MTDAGTYLIALAGFTSLLFSMHRHQHDWVGHELGRPTSSRLRILGLLLLAAAFVLATAGLGWGYGSVLWFGWLTAAGATVVLANVNRPRLARLFENKTRR